MPDGTDRGQESTALAERPGSQGDVTPSES